MKPRLKDGVESAFNNSLSELASGEHSALSRSASAESVAHLPSTSDETSDHNALLRSVSADYKDILPSSSADEKTKMEDKALTSITREECYNQEDTHDKESERSLLKQKLLSEQQWRDIQVFYSSIIMAT